MIRDCLQIFSMNCDCYYFIFVIRDFINIFLVICERDLIFLVKMIKKNFAMEYYRYKCWCIMCMNGKYIVNVLFVFDPINTSKPNVGVLSAHIKETLLVWRGGVKHDVGSETTDRYGKSNFNCNLGPEYSYLDRNNSCLTHKIMLIVSRHTW